MGHLTTVLRTPTAAARDTWSPVVALGAGGNTTKKHPSMGGRKGPTIVQGHPVGRQTAHQLGFLAYPNGGMRAGGSGPLGSIPAPARVFVAAGAAERSGAPSISLVGTGHRRAGIVNAGTGRGFAERHPQQGHRPGRPWQGHRGWAVGTHPSVAGRDRPTGRGVRIVGGEGYRSLPRGPRALGRHHHGNGRPTLSLLYPSPIPRPPLPLPYP